MVNWKLSTICVPGIKPGPCWARVKEIRCLLCTFSHRDFHLLLPAVCVSLCADVYLDFIRTISCLIRIGRLPFEEHRCTIELYGLHGMRWRFGHCKWNWRFNIIAFCVCMYMCVYMCSWSGNSVTHVKWQQSNAEQKCTKACGAVVLCGV